MEFKGTKGNWELTNRNRGVEVLIKPSTYKSICTTTGNTKWQFDMLLISKAPEMLEMIELLIDRLEENDLGNLNAVERAKQLIKQATEL